MKHIFFFLFLPIYLFSQPTISGTFSPAEDYKYVFLYRTTPTSSEFIARSEVDASGTFEITNEDDYKPGFYKLVYAMPPERYNFNLILNGKEGIKIDFNANDGLKFVESEENKLWASYTNSLDMINATISNYYASGKKDTKAYKDIFKTLKDTYNAYVSNSKGLLVNKLIIANKPFIPETYMDASEYVKGLEENYLDAIDFTDPLLQSSDFLSQRVFTYIFPSSLAVQNDRYKNKIDILSGKLNNTEPLVQLQLLYPVWQNFSVLGNDQMAMYMIDSILLKAAKDANKPMLVETFTNYKNTAVGVKAINFDLGLNSSTLKGKSLFDLKDSDYYLLVFWSSTCHHCLEELPQLKQFLNDYNHVNVVAYAIEDDAVTWEEEIKNYPNFIHVLGLNKWENEVVEAYNISATPTYFLLDSDKTILAKPYDLTAVKNTLTKLD